MGDGAELIVMDPSGRLENACERARRVASRATGGQSPDIARARHRRAARVANMSASEEFCPATVNPQQKGMGALQAG